MKTNHSTYVPFTDEQLQRMGELYLEGLSFRKLSVIYGISAHAVDRRLKWMGIPARKPGSRAKVTPETLVQVAAMRARNVPWKLIEKETGWAASTLQMAHKRSMRSAS